MYQHIRSALQTANRGVSIHNCVNGRTVSDRERGHQVVRYPFAGHSKYKRAAISSGFSHVSISPTIGNPLTLVPRCIQVLANSNVSCDTCDFASEMDTPRAFIILLYSAASL